MSRRCAETGQLGNVPDLAAKQAALVRALTEVTPLPAGFDTAGVGATARMLVRKRARGVASALPAIRHALGDRFVPLFAEFATHSRLPATGGSAADARAFLRWLRRAGYLDDELRLELLRSRLRDGWPIAVAWLRDRRSIAVGLALPGTQPRCVWLPLGHRRLSEHT